MSDLEQPSSAFTPEPSPSEPSPAPEPEAAPAEAAIAPVSDDACVCGCVLREARAGRDLTVERSLILGAAAGGDINGTMIGAPVLVAGRDMRIRGGGGTFLVAGNSVRLRQGAVGSMIVGNSAKVRDSRIGVVFSPRVELVDSTVAMTSKQAAALGAALGVVLLLGSLLARLLRLRFPGWACRAK